MAELYALFKGISEPVKLFTRSPNVGDNKRYYRGEFARNNDVVADDSRVINAMMRQLREADKDGYRSLASGQPLVTSGLVPLAYMKEALAAYTKMLQENFVWAEWIIPHPDKIFPDYRLPDGKNGALVRGPWTTNYIGAEVDFRYINPQRHLVPVNMPKSIITVSASSEWATILGTEDTELYCGSYFRNITGDNLKILLWKPSLTRVTAWHSGYDQEGAIPIIVSTRSMDKIVEEYQKA